MNPEDCLSAILFAAAVLALAWEIMQMPGL
jgi:hypothetical protein